MRDVVQNAPTWTVASGLSGGIYSILSSLDFLGCVSLLAIIIGILATLHKMYLDRKVAKAQMEKLKQDDK